MKTWPKEFITAHGNDGYIVFYTDNGAIVERHGYYNITRVDSHRYLRDFPNLNNPVDIIDLGYWYNNRQGELFYEPPVAVYIAGREE